MSKEISALFGEAPSSVDLTENTASSDKEASISLLIIAAVVVALRFYARILPRQKPVKDDWFIVICLIFVCAAGVTAIIGGESGIGRHVWALTVPQLENSFKSVFVYLMMYGGAVSTSKISILLFYQRVFTTNSRFFRVLVGCGYFICISYFISMYVATLTACQPLTRFWTQFSGAEGTCINTNLFFFMMGLLNMIADIYVLVIPIPQIIALQMSWKKKLAVLGIMLIGVFVCAASVVRIYYLVKLTKTVDITGSLGPLFIWSIVEPTMAIVSASLPHLLPLRHAINAKFGFRFSSSKKSGGKPTGNDGQLQERSTGASGALYTYGGSRFNSGRMKLTKEDDEMELTTRVDVDGGKASTHYSNSAEDINAANRITVKSSIVQTSTELR